MPSRSTRARRFLGDLWLLARPYWFSEERVSARLLSPPRSRRKVEPSVLVPVSTVVGITVRSVVVTVLSVRVSVRVTVPVSCARAGVATLPTSAIVITNLRMFRPPFEKTLWQI